MTTRIRRSSGNVFKDLGFPAEEAAHLRIRADLMIALSRVIDDRGLTQVKAAELFGVSQPSVSDLVRGKGLRPGRFQLTALLQVVQAQMFQ